MEQIIKLFNFLSEIPKDKLLHFFYGSLVAFVVAMFFGAWWAMLSALVVGVFKEVVDYFDHGDVESRDLLFTVLGGAVVCLPLVLGG